MKRNCEIEEERAQKEIELVLTKTNGIISSLTDQATKMSKLYSDEADVKATLQKVLNDERDTLQKLAKVATSIEIFSDIIIEYEALTGMMGLIPHMLEEIENGIMAVADQSIFPSLLPAENIKKKIPQQTKISIMTPTVSAFQTPSEAYIEFKLFEYMPAFNIYHITTLPIITKANTENSAFYLKFNLTTNLVAQNGLQETFQYNPGTCTTKRGFIICAPHQVRIHTNPTTCEETMLSPDTTNWNICTNSLQISKVNTQSTKFIQTLSKIRIFSPYKDNISTLCGGNFTKNLTTILPGYTDMKASSACVIYTKELKITTPILPTDESDVKVSFSIPDLSNAIDDLINDIEIVHGLNFTQLQEDFATLAKDISMEQKSIKEVQTSLSHIKTIKEIDNFDLMHIDLETIHTPSTKMKIGFWVSFGIAIILLLSCTYLCCPAFFIKIIGNFFTGIFLILKKLTCFGWNTIKSIRNKRQHIPEREDATPEREEMWSDQSLQLIQPNRNQPTARKSILKPDSRRSSISRSFSDIFNPERVFSPDRRNETEFQMGNFGPPPTYGQSLYPSTETLKTTAFNTPASSTSTNWVDTPTSPELLENDYTWRIETPDACRCILVKQSHGSKIYFIPQLQETFLADGTKMPTDRPIPPMLADYMNRFYKLNPVTIKQFQKKFCPQWNFDHKMQSFCRNIQGSIYFKYDN